MGGVRYANIGLAVGISVLAIGMFLFRHAGEGVLRGVVIAAFIVTFGVYHGLDERNKRRERRQ